MKTWLLIVLSSLACVAPVLADSIYVAPVKGTNIPNNELKAIRELVITNIQSTQHTVAETQDKADFFLQSKLIKFANYTLSMTKWDGNKKVQSGQWKAESSAQLEAATQKAVEEILGKKSIVKSSQQSLGAQVTQRQQTQNNQRVAANRQVLFGFGPSFFNNLNSSDSGLALLLGYYWNVNDKVDLGLQTDFAFSTEHSDSNMFTAKILANYFPVLFGDTSPYLGAGFGYGYASAHDGSLLVSSDRANGFAGSLQAGFKFFRTSSVNLGVGFDYTVIFDKTDFGTPSRLIFNVGLYF